MPIITFLIALLEFEILWFFAKKTKNYEFFIVFRSKLEKIEKKLIVGGENLLEKVEEQAKLLEVNNKELEQSKFQEAHLRTQLEERTAVKVEIEERYSSLQEEAFVKSKKIKKVSNELKDARAELKDLEEDHQRQVEAMLDDIRQLRKVSDFLEI